MPLLEYLLAGLLFGYLGWRWWRRKGAHWVPPVVAPEPTAPVVPVDAPAPVAVLNLPTGGPSVVAMPEGRRLWFRDAVWLEDAALVTARRPGVVTFYREAAVDGRPVRVELQANAADLVPSAEGTLTLRGRQ
jgi:hypothetical protein